jgi:3-oxoacyl-[acyl-carrier-protein] synthase-1
MAIEGARALLQRDEADLCLAGGVDSYLETETLEWIEDSHQLHSLDNSWGFVPGEAAGFCLLASPRAARALKGGVLARLIGVATAREENRIKTETICLGRGLTQALHQALEALPTEALVDQVICDLNGEPYRANELAFTMTRLARRFASPGEFLAPADCWGDVGAASGPLFAALAVAAGARGYGRGPRNLLWASSEGGQRCAALLQVEAASPAYH